jgi:hypothetical protein
MHELPGALDQPVHVGNSRRTTKLKASPSPARTTTTRGLVHGLLDTAAAGAACRLLRDRAMAAFGVQDLSWQTEAVRRVIKAWHVMCTTSHERQATRIARAWLGNIMGNRTRGPGECCEATSLYGGIFNKSAHTLVCITRRQLHMSLNTALCITPICRGCNSRDPLWPSQRSIAFPQNGVKALLPYPVEQL